MLEDLIHEPKYMYADEITPTMARELLDEYMKTRIAEKWRVAYQETAETIEHESTDEIVCPHCGYEFNDSWEFRSDSGVIDCEECGKTFRYERELLVYYSTSKVVENR